MDKSTYEVPRWIVYAMYVYYMGVRCNFVDQDLLEQEYKRHYVVECKASRSTVDQVVTTNKFFINSSGKNDFVVRLISHRHSMMVNFKIS